MVNWHACNFSPHFCSKIEVDFKLYLGIPKAPEERIDPVVEGSEEDS
jgi:hypothetical protein